MSGQWKFCRCPCHAGEAAPISDRIEAVIACEKCKDDHVQKYAKDPSFRKEKFDKPEPFKPDTSTAWNDDQSDGGEGRED